METKLLDPPILSLHFPSCSSSTTNFTCTFFPFPLRNNHHSIKLLTHNSHTDPIQDKQQSQSSKPIYSPTPPNRQLWTPHNGYSFIPSSIHFFNFIITILHYSIEIEIGVLGITLMELLKNSLKVGTSKFPFLKGDKAFALCIQLRIPRFPSNWSNPNPLSFFLLLLLLIRISDSF
jgi:hypothetical protein